MYAMQLLQFLLFPWTRNFTCSTPVYTQLLMVTWRSNPPNGHQVLTREANANCPCLTQHEKIQVGLLVPTPSRLRHDTVSCMLLVLWHDLAYSYPVNQHCHTCGLLKCYESMLANSLLLHECILCVCVAWLSNISVSCTAAVWGFACSRGEAQVIIIAYVVQAQYSTCTLEWSN